MKKFKLFLISICLFLFMPMVSLADEDIKNLDINFSNGRIISYDEMISGISKSRDISIDTAKVLYPDILSSSNLNKSTSSSYYYINSQFTVTSEYKPTAYFYCIIETNGSTRSIVNILDAGINRLYSGITKQFSGTLTYYKETPQRIHYIVNGDWLNNGTTTVSGSFGLEAGGWRVNFGVSGSTNHYTYSLNREYAYIR